MARRSVYEIEGLPDIDDSWTIPKDHLTIKNEIGKGAFGTVYKADYLGIDVAVKTISKGGSTADPMEKTFAKREIAVLKSCRHPNVVAFIGVVENDESEGLQIVLEYLSKGDLGHFLLDNPEPISWIRKVKIALDVACGMAYLHARSIIFRDLKSENLLLDDTGKTKICDFGFARKSIQRSRMTMCGTDEFMAPEIMMGNEYDFKADVFSYGMLLFEIITRKDVGQVIPRVPDNGYAINETSLRNQLPRDCPQHFMELGFLCVKYAPDKRPDFLKIIAFLKKLLKRLIDLKKGAGQE
eukprot:TRINITY_DN282_c0_g1_i1.p1 TRINITY_DN282_c0_g1~~TRINITY_DN282_c0_g1_i1.p1  ORF type:complete len:297 (-),score=52.08 TRINITY_DN282_c0_g1_i1:195-1085(-)